MKNRFIFLLILVFVFVSVFSLAAIDALAAIANINPIIDNTLAEELPDNSSGECDSIFAGMTNEPAGVGSARRALLQFDIAGQILAGSIINSVTLSMTITRGGNNSNAVFSLHRVNTAWGEGTNTCGVRGGGQGEAAVDGAATWNAAMHNQTLWGTPGGDYNATASGSTSIVGADPPAWDSTAPGNAAMVSDVQGWLDGTTPNFGWILIGDENIVNSTRRFGSSENAVAPVLVVDYTPVGATLACCLAEPFGDCAEVLDEPQGTGAGEQNCIALGGTLSVGGEETCTPNPCPQPIGACCNADESCSEVSRDVCEAGGGLFQGADSLCTDNNVDCGLTPFIEPLPIPPILQPTGTRADGVLQYTVSVEEAAQNVHSKLPDTTVWTYNGAWPAATIVATKDTPIEVTYVNNLSSGGGGGRGTNLLEVDTCAHGPNSWADSKRIVTHLHGGHVPARVDGQPEYHILPGERDIYEYPNNQDAATLWYHDHALGITRLNVYGGMAGYYLLADSEDTLGPDNAFGLPSGQYEIGLAIQDRIFNPDGSLFYNAQLEEAFKGDKIVVNGKVWPFLNVDQGKYRFRILNGSQSREYSLRLENITNPGNDPSFLLVGTDVGLVSAPIDLGNTISTFVPADRLDVVIDFAGYPVGTEIVMRNDEQTSPLLPNIMKFVVTGNPGYTGTISSTLRPVTPMPENSADVTRYFRLVREPNQLCKDASGRSVTEWLVESLDGPGGNVIGKHWDDLTEFPILGNREVWEFENPTSSMHPMHVHLVKYQILSKETLGGQPIPLETWEINTWKDTVRVPPNSRVKIIMDFTDYLGRFPQHCHILDHEDHEMMRQFQTTNDPANADIDGICSANEDCVSNPTDCAKVSGALCGNGLCEEGDGENCVTCPEDCAGKQKGSASKQFCCGFDDGQVTNPISCGVDANDNRCIDSSMNLYCRVAQRLEACCGDRLCEGQETAANCAVDCAAAVPCTYVDPSVSITPAAQDVDAGNSVTYTVSVTNNDTGDCSITTFNLTVDDSDNGADFVLPSTLSANLVQLLPAESQDVILTVTAQPDGTQSNDTAVIASDPALNHADVASNMVTTTILDACVPDETPEQSCFDGNNNDCDTLTDCADIADCDGAIGAPTTCGIGVCAATGNLTCSGGTEVDTCTPGTPGTEGPAGDPSCSDGLDNDCDELTDTAEDPDCQNVVCENIQDRNQCRSFPQCQWKKGACLTR
ncbi:MAG: multicopper oxidase domain-containing protein [Nitrospiraceae bacterium]|nr:MAG: multicopper oxidase domain-containing protein [Nitrospiraceae bacterium]